MSVQKSLPVPQPEDKEDDEFRGIFPEEIWVLILANLTPSKELMSVSPFFRRLLEARKKECLFGKVFAVYERVRYRNHEIGENFPPLLKYIPKDPNEIKDVGIRKMLKLRLVCKSWKTGIEEFYKEKFFTDSHQGIVFSRKMSQCFQTSKSMLDFHDRKNIPKFLAHFKETHDISSDNGETVNPFLTNTVILDIAAENKDEELDDEKAADVIALLEKYGHHIHDCSINFHDKLTTSLPFERLINWMGYLGNVKRLEINNKSVEASVPYDLDQYGHHPVECLTPAEEIKLVAHMESNPIPKLNNLVCLKMKELAPVFVHKLIRDNNHVPEIELKTRFRENSNIFSVPLPNLNHLRIDLYSEEFVELETAQFSSTFKKLGVRFLDEEPRHADIFTALDNKWGKTLTHLNLTFQAINDDLRDQATIKEQCAILQEELMPRLTQLTVRPKWRTELDDPVLEGFWASRRRRRGLDY